ncbi:hypothetical protein [Streptomyces sp.]|uniref:hypothetical protein n=1 Tax=Streptomyces sp. TaxID=1931 RepID=UPI002810BE1B|nr:hypothetical protein [Streptomyces sp.]
MNHATGIHAVVRRIRQEATAELGQRETDPPEARAAGPARVRGRRPGRDALRRFEYGEESTLA